MCGEQTCRRGHSHDGLPVPQAALRPHPARDLPDIHWTRATMGSLIAPRPLLCYPSLHPGFAAFMTTHASSGGRMTPHTGLHPRLPVFQV